MKPLLAEPRADRAKNWRATSRRRFNQMANWIAASVKHAIAAIDQNTVIQLMEPKRPKKLQNEQRNRRGLLRGNTLARPCKFYTTCPPKKVKSRYGLAAYSGDRGSG